jgi:hypothetical protein
MLGLIVTMVAGRQASGHDGVDGLEYNAVTTYA